MTQANLYQAVRAWIADDPDQVTRELLEQALAASDDVFLSSCFNGFLEFGTAGLRGPMGPGPSRMNRAVVGRTALGIASYMKERELASIVIGYDARHGSHQFALDTAELMAGAGINAHLMPRTLPTPVLAFAVNHLQVDAGIMVTASHNPAQDNGYKVYLGGTVDGIDYRGSQIISPADQQIAAEIMKVSSLLTAERSDEWIYVDERVIDAYIHSTTSTLGGKKALRVVHTALHGVGSELFTKVTHHAGYEHVYSVLEQAVPDPDFPTVAFPNPEEKGAIDLAIAYAKNLSADLVIANDPDADRAAAAFFDRGIGDWRMLRGDEVGVILGEMLAREVKTSGQAPAHFAVSIVSSSLLRQIASHYAIAYTETLTGFKWITKVAGLTFGYEEALGYCIDPANVNDKDGLSAALKLMDIAESLARESRTLDDLLDEIALRYGVFATDQISIRVDDVSLIASCLQRIRANLPTTLANSPVVSFEDLSRGGALPPTEGFRIHTDHARVIIRPSGTEPKLKCYLEYVLPVFNGDLNGTRKAAAESLSALSQAVSELISL